MSDYIFSTENPPSLNDQGVDFVIHHPEFPDVLKAYNIAIPAPPPPSNISLSLPDRIKGVLKSQYVWKRLGEVRTLATKQNITVTERITQSLTESRSLRALVRATVSAEANGAFVSAKAELTAEVEATIETQETWTKETFHSRTIEIEAHRTYAFWNLVKRVSVSYSSSSLIQAISGLDFILKMEKEKNNKKGIAELSSYRDKLKALKDMEHDFDLLVHYHEDSKDNEKALIASLQGF